MMVSNKLKSKVLEGTFWYTLVGLLNGSLNLLLLPILTRWLDTDEFGLLNTVMAISATMMPVVTAGLGAGVVRYYHEYRDEEERFRRFFSASFWCQVIVVLFLSVMLFFLFGTGVVDSMLGIDVVYLIPVFLVIILVPLRDLGNQLLTTQEQHKKASVNQFVAFAAALGCTLWFMGVNEWGVLGRLYALVCGSVVAALMLVRLPEMRSILLFSIDKSELKTALRFGLPYIPFALVMALMLSSDKLLIGKYEDLEDVGLYSAAKSLTLGMSCIFLALTRAWYPRYFSLRDSNEEEKVMGGQWLVLCSLLIIVIGFMILYPVVFPVVVDERYLEGAEYLSVLAMCIYFYGVFSTQASYITYLKKTLYLPVIAVVGFMVHLALALYFLPRFGAIAVGWSTMFGYLTMVVLLMVIGAKMEGRHLERLWLPLLSIILAVAGYGCCQVIPSDAGWLLRMGLCVLSCLLVYVVWACVQYYLNKRYAMEGGF